MQFAILKILSGQATGRKAVIRPGQVLRVGRAFDADLSIPEDAELAEQHFVFDATQNGCQIRCYPDCELAFGEESATERPVYNGEQFRAGATEFVINIEGELAAAPRKIAETEHAEPEAQNPSAPPPDFDLSDLNATDVLELYEADDVTNAALKPEMNCLELLSVLGQQEEFKSCVQLLSFALPKQHAVWWAIGCVERTSADTLTDQETAALEAAKAWVIDPSEENRREAETTAEPIKMGSAAGVTTLGAFWSGGSLGPPEYDDVAPPDNLTGQAVYAAMLMTFNAGEGRDVNLPGFYEAGIKIANGEDLWV